MSLETSMSSIPATYSDLRGHHAHADESAMAHGDDSSAAHASESAPEHLLARIREDGNESALNESPAQGPHDSLGGDSAEMDEAMMLNRSERYHRSSIPRSAEFAAQVSITLFTSGSLTALLLEEVIIRASMASYTDVSCRHIAL